METITIKGAVIQFLSTWKQLFLFKIVIERLRQLAWENPFQWNQFSYYGDRLSEIISQVEQIPSILRQVVCDNYLV